MTLHWVRMIAGDFGANLSEEMQAAAVEIASDYTERQLESIRIYLQRSDHKVFRPKIISQAAYELGYAPGSERKLRKALEIETFEPPHQCHRCEDTGLLWMVFEWQVDDEGKRRYHPLATFPRSRVYESTEMLRQGEGRYTRMGRCQCLAGERRPKAIGRI